MGTNKLELDYEKCRDWKRVNPFRALKPTPILIPSNFAPKTGFQLKKRQGRWRACMPATHACFLCSALLLQKMNSRQHETTPHPKPLALETENIKHTRRRTYPVRQYFICFPLPHFRSPLFFGFSALQPATTEFPSPG